jgi:hypothetical protein
VECEVRLQSKFAVASLGAADCGRLPILGRRDARPEAEADRRAAEKRTHNPDIGVLPMVICGQFTKQRLRILQVIGGNALREPAVDGRKEITGYDHSPLPHHSLARLMAARNLKIFTPCRR